ncbi:hypothetical protein [Streptomyces sp. NPDC021224]|uniref:hypothetical protein n=1 Tax=unclassified Streptomyces TaxID=2593676 RepID=UPI0037BB142B
MSALGVWVVGVLADEAVEEARRRFPDAARAHGTWPEALAGTDRWSGPFPAWSGGAPEPPLHAADIARFTDAVEGARNDESDADELQDHLLHALPPQEGEGTFCAAVPRGDGAAALMWGLGPDATPRLPGCCGQFLLDAAQVRAALPPAEQALALPPPRRALAAARIRLWLAETANDPDCDIDELLDGPLRVLRHASRTGVGAAGLTFWY